MHRDKSAKILQKTCHEILTPISHEYDDMVGFAFVDDTDIVAGSLNLPNEDILDVHGIVLIFYGG